MDGDALVVLGRVIGVHGLRGALEMRFHSGAAPAGLNPGAAVRLRLESGEPAVFTATGIDALGDRFRVRLERIANREQAEALVGAEMVAARRELPEPEADAYYWIDLLGLAVLTLEGEYLGRLTAILETGGNDVSRVRGEGREVLVPALASVVRRVDPAAGRMWVDLPEGL